MSPVGLAVVESWRFEPRLALLLTLTALVYWRGWRILRRQTPERFAPRQLWSFLAGLAAVYVALASPLDAFAALLLQVHMVQHLLLMTVAPPLLLLGAPAIPLLRGLPARIARDGVGPFLAAPELRRLADFVGHPLTCWLAMAVATWFWHAPAPYQLALRSPFWHQVEHFCFLVGGLLFWWPVIQPWPSRARWPAWTLPLYLLAADVQNTILAAIFVFSERALYPVYEAVPRLGGLSARDDQVAAGAIMWVPMSLAYLVPAAVITVRLLSPRMSRGATPVYADQDVPLRRRDPRLDLLALPHLGPLLRSLRTRRAGQLVMLALAAAVVADGLLGPQMSPMNLAGVLPWTYWRGFTVVALLTAGNLFCMACPFTLPRALLRRIGVEGRAWPEALGSKWIAIALLVGFFLAYEVGGLWDAPRATAWLILAFFAAAFAVDALFSGASFCKWVCPIGQFHFVQSLLSPFEVKIRRPAACASCTTHDCLRGNAQRNGCELDLFLPRKAGSLDCTFCLDCVRACPHDNVGLMAVAPARELWRDPDRSSLGRLSRRLDVAALALVLVFAGLVMAAAMVGPVAEAQMAVASFFAVSMNAVTAVVLVGGIVLLPPVLLAATSTLSLRLGAGRVSFGEIFCRFSMALVPIGLATWAAHFLFHLLAGWSSAMPALRRALVDVGLRSVAEPVWTMGTALVGADTLVQLEILLLDAGLLLSLYSGWKVASSYGSSARALLLPWALVAIALWAGGVWVFLQPMEMRGLMVH